MLNFPGMLNVQLAGLAGFVSSAEGRPPQQAYAVFDELETQVDAQTALLEEAIQSDVAAFNQQVQEAQLAAISI